MKPMLPTLKSAIPPNKEWAYEVKYDGFRALLEWKQNSLHLWSRNEKDLLPQFPEIESFLLSIREKIGPYLPLTLDGELVLLENPLKANFGQLQIRGRMKSASRIKEASAARPCRYLVFDLLEKTGQDVRNQPYIKRKKDLHQLFQSAGLPLSPKIGTNELLQYIPFSRECSKLWRNIEDFESEGIVAKQVQSKWETGRRTESWLKTKNWKKAFCFITAFDSENGYYDVGVYRGDSIFSIGLFLFSIQAEQKQALTKVIKDNSYRTDKNKLYIKPSICVEIDYLEWYEDKMREAHFHSFRFDLSPEDCTYVQFLLNQADIPTEIDITHPNKPLWERPPIEKLDFILYMRKVFPFMHSFLENRTLTVIRFPHGTFGDPFYQKNCPEYAPDYVQTVRKDNIDYIVCNDLNTYIWLANQLAVEFHIPFHTITSKSQYASEIVFDLDPPSRQEFYLAIEASLIMKEVFDQLNLISFIKTSGNKGLQVYIPLPEETFTWEETRLFTEFVADYLITKEPDKFTVERLKKNREGRLYIDIVQHAEGKTIIAPYSMRGNDEALIATPLFWEEVTESLHPEKFTISVVKDRLNVMGCPFAFYFDSKNIQPFAPVLSFLMKEF
ncbi:DNA ligase D [Heyndrickxia acidicola]|uniref:DNA ligase (ATP) n=1 Tax=Heyndrickxia acidicola TaxID=209389 RepID=A0ABU6MLN1_9BACI|nr:DNA ligase D [Heyndrickxia acidicola]MED1205404.1 DNA ligase D [Heyndrickxia acidicola]